MEPHDRPDRVLPEQMERIGPEVIEPEEIEPEEIETEEIEPEVKKHNEIFIHPLPFFASSTSKLRQKRQKCKKKAEMQKKAENALRFQNSCKKG